MQRLVAKIIAMKKILPLLLGVLSSFCVGQQDTPFHVAINGHAVQTRILQRGEHYYIDLEDLARALNASLVIRNDNIALSTSPATSDGEARNDGSIRGTITYYFNDNYGNRPDVGAEVWVTKERVVMDDYDSFSVGADELTMRNWPDGNVSQHVRVFKHTTVDGSGNFDIDQLPEGKYTIIVRSNHVKGKSQRDISGKVVTKSITIENGASVDASQDFGMSAF